MDVLLYAYMYVLQQRTYLYFVPKLPSLENTIAWNNRICIAHVRVKKKKPTEIRFYYKLSILTSQMRKIMLASPSSGVRILKWEKCNNER